MFQTFFNWIARKKVKSKESEQESIPLSPKLKIDLPEILSNNIQNSKENEKMFDNNSINNAKSNNLEQINSFTSKLKPEIIEPPVININEVIINDSIPIQSELNNQNLSLPFMLVPEPEKKIKNDLDNNLSLNLRDLRSTGAIQGQLFSPANYISISKLSLYKKDNSSINYKYPKNDLQNDKNFMKNNYASNSDSLKLNKINFNDQKFYKSAGPPSSLEIEDNLENNNLIKTSKHEVHPRNWEKVKQHRSPIDSNKTSKTNMKQYQNNLIKKGYQVNEISIIPDILNLPSDKDLSLSQFTQYMDNIMEKIEKLNKLKEKINKITDITIITKDDFQKFLQFTKEKGDDKNYPVLTQEMFIKVYQFFSARIDFHTELRHEDMRTLLDKESVSDNIINKYLKLLCNRFEESTIIVDAGKFEEAILKEKKSEPQILNDLPINIEFKSCKRLIIPIKRNTNHRSCFIVYFKNSMIEYYDSLKFDMKEETKEYILIKKFIDQYFDHEVSQKRKWSLQIKECPIQKKFVDSGVLLLMNIDYLSRNLYPNYLSTDCDYFRYLILISILERKLLTS